MNTTKPGRQLLSQGVIVHAGVDQRVANPLVHTNLCAARDELFAGSIMHEYVPRTFTHQEVFLGRYPPNTLLDTQQGYLVVCGSHAVREQVSPWLQEQSAAVMETRKEANKAREIDVPSFLAARFGETTWGHWILEILPKVIVAEKTFPGLFVFVVPRNIVEDTRERTYSTSVVESLAAFGISRERLIPVGDYRIYLFSALFDVFGLHNQNVPHQMALDVLRTLQPSKIDKPIQRKIAVLRRLGDRRSLLNYNKISEQLIARGYDILDPQSIPFRDQVAAFQSADLVVGELGSGLTGLAFSQRGTRVLTLGPLNWPDTYFTPLMQMLDLRVADARGVSVRFTPDDKKMDRSPENSFYIISPSDLENALDALELIDEPPLKLSSRILGREWPRHLGHNLGIVRFGSRFGDALIAANGLLPAEEELQWSTGEVAMIEVRSFTATTKHVWLELRGMGFVVPDRYLFKDVRVIVNGTFVGSICLQGVCHEFFLLPVEIVEIGGCGITIMFQHLSCPSPKSMGVSDDDRALGIGLKSVAFYETASHNEGPDS